MARFQEHRLDMLIRRILRAYPPLISERLFQITHRRSDGIMCLKGFLYGQSRSFAVS
jgi:hypothetical protein